MGSLLFRRVRVRHAELDLLPVVSETTETSRRPCDNLCKGGRSHDLAN